MKKFLLVLAIMITAALTVSCQTVTEIDTQSFNLQISADYYDWKCNCGIWVTDTVYSTDWVPFDTLGYATTDLREWVYDEERLTFTSILEFEGDACGNLSQEVYERRRICTKTGIIERKIKVKLYKYESSNNSLYQIIVDKFVFGEGVFEKGCQ